MTSLHSILRISNNSLTVVRSVEVPIIALIVKAGISLSMSLLLDLDFESDFMLSHRDTNRILEELLRILKTISPVGEPEGSNDFTEVPFDDEQILRQHKIIHGMRLLALFSKGDEFIKSSVDDLIPILRECELTLDSTDFKYSMPIDAPLSCTGVLGDAIADIDLLFGEHLDTLSTGDREIDFNPSRDIEELERLLAVNPVPVLRVFNKPLGNAPVYDQGPCYNQNFSHDQPPFYSLNKQQQFDCCEVCGGPHYSSNCQSRNQLVYEPSPGEPEGSNDFTEVPFDDEQILRQHKTTNVTPPPLAYTPTPLVLATMEPLDTFLIGDECTGVLGDAIADIDLLFGEHLDTLSTGDKKIDFNPSRDIEELEHLLSVNPVPVLKVFNKPLGNFDSVPRSYDVTFLNSLFDFNDDYNLCYNNSLFDVEFKDISSLDLLESTPVIDESTLIVTPPLASNQISLREVERFDLFSP
nr:NAC domain-containing protein [Tanacetum cinerariifolium]